MCIYYTGPFKIYVIQQCYHNISIQNRVKFKEIENGKEVEWEPVFFLSSQCEGIFKIK